MTYDHKQALADEELARQLQAQEDEAATASTVPSKQPTKGSPAKGASPNGDAPPSYASTSRQSRPAHAHTNPIIEASKLRARDEQTMQNWLQTIQYANRIYNAELEPEHDVDYPCNCEIHRYQSAKWSRARIQDQWNDAVIYPGEKSYNANRMYSPVFTNNPYQYVISPYLGNFNAFNYGPKQANPRSHATWISQTISLNNSLNQKAQIAIDAREPKISIWKEEGDEDDQVDVKGDVKRNDNDFKGDVKGDSKGDTKLEKRQSVVGSSSTAEPSSSKGKGKFASFKKSIGLKTSEEKQQIKLDKAVTAGLTIRNSILQEEAGRWPDEQWRAIVAMYQQKVGMAAKIADLRANCPIQYLHLLRAGYFEPIPVAWANQASNPLKFIIEGSEGWRGITPAWRGYEDTAEERLYWVLNHRGIGARLKPDFISALEMARQRMASAVPPPPEYFDTNDTCHPGKGGYSNQVMPAPFKAFDRPETAADDTMILLDVSGSMNFEPMRPRYDRYLITGFEKSTQPKNRDLAQAVVRRFVDAMMNHDRSFEGYDLTTFANAAQYIGTIHHRNMDAMWSRIKFGGGTRVMTGWQKVKELHFEKHSHSAIHHPIYGWQAGPETPILRLLLLLDGEATDMDEFELDLLGLDWAHVTIFLIGVDGCPHHHRHANELQRISDVNHHVSFVDAQGNTPERFVTHELLKRHLGYDVSMSEFQEMELPPTYQAATAR